MLINAINQINLVNIWATIKNARYIYVNFNCFQNSTEISEIFKLVEMVEEQAVPICFSNVPWIFGVLNRNPDGKKLVFYLLNYINFIFFEYSHVFHLNFFFSLIMVLRIQKHIDNNLHILLFFWDELVVFCFLFYRCWSLCLDSLY